MTKKPNDAQQLGTIELLAPLLQELEKCSQEFVPLRQFPAWNNNVDALRVGIADGLIALNITVLARVASADEVLGEYQTWAHYTEGGLGKTLEEVLGRDVQVVALQKAGGVFIHSPPDPNGLWIHRAVAEILNRQDMKELRRGYSLAIYNSRGAHFVDPSGAPERDLARTYTEKADAVENAGYHRVATTLREIAEWYELEAKRIIAESQGRTEVSDDEQN